MRLERANAKINLYLNVTSRRENGYHDIVSIMQTVSLCDLVTLDFWPGEHTGIELTVSGNEGVPTDCRNLAWRAAELYLGETGLRGRVKISIEKHIPMAAGLAGGSSDAAAVLRGLNRLAGNRMSLEALCALGARLGADIPFCITGGGSLVSGIGDRLEPIASMPDCHMVVACMGEGVSTPWAYGKLDEHYQNFVNKATVDERPTRIVRALEEGRVADSCADYFNLFEEVVPTVQPYVERLKATMDQNGAIRSMMSGSGPSVFGVFATMAEAEAACAALTQMGAAAFVCHPRAAYAQN